MTHEELLDEVARFRKAYTLLMQEMLIMTRKKAGEPYLLAAQPILDAYAEEAISGGRARELLRCWAHGATREEIVAMLPEESVDEG
jgi:hypothetical protein